MTAPHPALTSAADYNNAEPGTRVTGNGIVWDKTENNTWRSGATTATNAEMSNTRRTLLPAIRNNK